MPGQSTRREWLKTTSVFIAGIGTATTLFASEKERYRQAGIILLNSNENAYGPSAAARTAMAEALAKSNRYPDDTVTALKKQIAAFWDVNTGCILTGAGSSELIGLAVLLNATAKGNIVTAEPSYRVWNEQAEAMGMQFKRVPLTPGKNYDLTAMLAAIDADTRLIYVCNPNNPVGTYIDDHLLVAFAEEASKKCMVLIDEAYTEYSELPSLKDKAVQNPNIIVAKTFSKIYGLAGARCGYLIAHPETIKKLSSLQPWPDANVSLTTAAAAIAALRDQAFVKNCREKNQQAKEICYKTFHELSLEYIPSSANFILFNIHKIGSDFSKKMESNNIYVQYRNHFGSQWCRVSMGTLPEMQTFCDALKKMV